MRNFLTVWWRELSSCFLSPVAYVIQVVFLSLTGWVFLQMVEGHVETPEPLVGLLFKVLVFFWIPVLVPVITMRVFAEEIRSGTLETLLTAPVTDVQVVLGKYAGALSFLLLVAMPAVSSLFVLDWLSPGIAAVDMGEVAGGCLITVLLCAFFVAAGVLVSLLTCNQIVAAVCIFAAVVAWMLAGYAVRALPLGGAEAVGDYLAVRDHVVDFARGLLDTRPVVLYLTSTALLLFASVRALESRRWR